MGCLVLVMGLGLQAAPPDLDPVGLELFERSVRPLLQARCMKCHSRGAERLRGGLQLDSRAGWQHGGDSGPAIVPGEPERSLLVRAIRQVDAKLVMPPDGKLGEREIADVVDWIRRGAPDPRENPEANGSQSPRKIDLEAGRKHWAFQPLATPPAPEPRSAAACRSPVDRFVQAQLEAAGLEANPPADPRTLLRRAHFSLTGLPPTPEEVDALVSDSSPEAYERAVDRLLESPALGERWARHWLDLARFAESHGFEHDYDRPTAYHFRDFLIRAFNEDLPFDKFAAWQLAGDELEPENPLALMATGFLAAGTHSTQITKNQVEKERYDELDDMLATTGTTFLGLTLGCARCHDHKLDPIPQEDYYRLLATFTTTVRSEQDVNLAPVEHREAMRHFELEHEPLARELERFEREELPARLEAWLRTEGPGSAPAGPDWLVLGDLEARSKGGATFTPRGDGSLLAGGTNPDHDTQTFSTTVHTADLTALRIEALSEPSLVRGGPGRASNGNFALTDLRVTAAPADGSAPPSPVRLVSARSTFDQKGLGVAGAIDDDLGSAWAVDPEFGKDHAAVFRFASPVGFPPGTRLEITLRFENNTGHGIGRPRFSVTTLPGEAPLQGTRLPEAVSRLLRAPPPELAGLPERERKALLEWYRENDSGWLERSARVAEHAAREPRPQMAKVLISSEGVPAVRLHTQGDDFLPETHFLLRGDPSRKNGVAVQGFLRVLGGEGPDAARWKASPPPGSRTSHRRRALAAWLTDVEHGAGSLLARVIVNRLWKHHMGRGLVGTPSDFGTQGERPSHPELLDWLAGELVRGGWRLKPIHRLIVLSSAFRASGAVTPASAALDPSNRWLWRHEPRRLEAEAIRDTLLSVSGLLDRRMFGPGTLDQGQLRRSIYFTVKRSSLVPMMVLFDAPDGLQAIGDRAVTTVAPQALHALNSPLTQRCAEVSSRRLLAAPSPGPESVARAGYRLALGRAPDPGELADACSFLQAAFSGTASASEKAAAVRDFAHVLLGLNELIYVE